MSKIYVKCKTEQCNMQIIIQEEQQVQKNQLSSILNKKNYYLCHKCGKVNFYIIEDHLTS